MIRLVSKVLGPDLYQVSDGLRRVSKSGCSQLKVLFYSNLPVGRNGNWPLRWLVEFRLKEKNVPEC